MRRRRFKKYRTRSVTASSLLIFHLLTGYRNSSNPKKRSESCQLKNSFD